MFLSDGSFVQQRGFAWAFEGSESIYRERAYRFDFGFQCALKNKTQKKMVQKNTLVQLRKNALPSKKFHVLVGLRYYVLPQQLARDPF